MIILGLGSNIGDRLNNFRKAITALNQLTGLTIQQISPIYFSQALLPENAPSDWDQPYLNLAIRCETTLTPHALLKELKNIEWSIGRKPEIRHWGPRILDIDILAWNEEIIHTKDLVIPHANLQDRPFALWPLADIAPHWKFPLLGENHGKTANEIIKKWGSRFSGEAPYHTTQILQRIDTPILVGILNITPDSFSDGGLYSNTEKATQKALQIIQDGAEIIDIGAESTAPSANSITPEEEWERLEPILHSIKKISNSFIIPPKISVDTRHVETAKKAIDLGIDWLNDVSGFDQPAMIELATAAKVKCVVMHHMGIPARPSSVIPCDINPVDYIYRWGQHKINTLLEAGIEQKNIIFDPGIGFGKIASHSLDLIKHAEKFLNLHVPQLIGHSRKSFLAPFTPYPAHDRDIETLAISLFLLHKPVNYLRIHQIEWCARSFKIMKALESNINFY